jgi:putative ABC transport system permease protein
VAQSVVLEAVAIAVIGGIIAFGVYGAIMGVAAAIVRSQTGVVIDPLAWHPVLVWSPCGMIALSAVAGLVPALKAYRTDVATNLAPID